jgi:hypothetical protein
MLGRECLRTTWASCALQSQLPAGPALVMPSCLGLCGKALGVAACARSPLAAASWCVARLVYVVYVGDLWLEETAAVPFME